MNCREFIEFILAYLERELPEDQRRSFESHVADCPRCLEYLESYRKTVELGRACCADPEGPVPEEAPEALVQAVLRARRAQSRGE